MTTAVREILERAELLSSEEQMELATRLMEQARQSVKALPQNGLQRETSSAEPPAQPGAEAGVSEDDEDDDWLDTLDLKLMPPKRTYMAQARFHYVGRGKPLPYDFGDRFDTENEDDES